MTKVLKPILLDETGKKILEAISSLSDTQIPIGGKLGNVLAKNSDNDRDVIWKAPLKSYNDLEDKPLINGRELTGEQTSDSLNLQTKLQSGLTIKTINNTELLGAGNIEIKGVSDYNSLDNKPSINGTSLEGDLALELGKVDDVKVNGTSVLTDREADIDLSTYDLISDRKIAVNDLKTILESSISLSVGTEKTRAESAENIIATDLSSHTSNTTNPHKVTKEQLELGNVDNTSDLDKPISTATQTALNNKLDATGTATKATSDAEGNNIVDTYATKTYVDNLITTTINAEY